MMPKTDPASYPGRVIPGPQCPGTVWVRTGQVFSPPLTTRGYVVTYPNMMELFESLGVDMEISDMSFSLSLDKGQGCEWGSRNGLSSCTVVCGDGSREFYNSCVMALHAPDALKILGNQATFDETRTGGAFQYVYRHYLPLPTSTIHPLADSIECAIIRLLSIGSDIFLHCDKNSMPQNPAAWSAWSFLGSLDSKNLGETSLPYLVTLNPDHAPEHTLLKWSTGPPVPFVAASKASLELGHIQGRRGIWFRGAYQGYGFHEDGLKDLSINSCMTYGEECFFPGRHDRGACLLEEGGTMFTFEGTRKNNHLKTVLRIHSPQFYWKILIANRDLDSSVSRLNQKSSRAIANPSNVAQEGVVGVDVLPEPSHGREGERAQGKTRGKSKAPSVDALEPRVTTLEIALSAAQDSLEGLEERVDGLEREYTEFTVATKALIQEQANTLRGEFHSFHDELLKLLSFVQDELRTVRAEVDKVRSDWAWHKRTLVVSPASANSSDARRIDVPKPDTYDGTRNSTIVDNFLFRLDQ
ncbi:Amino oxidase domain-containing protein [Citrus sinensis]|nr:Amino oxidase domain-containing protein [Citrus sinensis]